MAITVPLGKAFQITLSTPSISRSSSFYEALGFTREAGDGQPFPWRIYSDACVSLLINEDGKRDMRLTWYEPELEDKAPLLAGLGIEFEKNYDFDNLPQIIGIKDPDGNVFTLVDGDGPELKVPQGRSLINFEQSDFMDPDKYPNKNIGVLGEIAFPVSNLDDSIAFWEKLGFDTLSINDHPYRWAILKDAHIVIGLHENDHFQQPAITYFAPDQTPNVTALKDGDIQLYGRFIGDNDKNQTLATPEGQQFFLFSLG